MSVLVAAFLLGLVFNAAPGAIFAETVRRGATGGFRPALAVQIGSLVGDATWAILGLLGVGILMQVDTLKWPVGLAGAAYLLWLSWDSWKAASVAFNVQQTEDAQARSALRSGVILSVTNPQNLAYWAALGSALGALGVSDPGVHDYVMFFTGFMIASVSWAIFCAAAIDRLFKKAGQKWVALTYQLCALMFLLLALNTVRGLFSNTLSAGAHISPPAVHSVDYTGFKRVATRLSSNSERPVNQDSQAELAVSVDKAKALWGCQRHGSNSRTLDACELLTANRFTVRPL